ncbi:M10 family metallopeptidase C-terminal domain-containing protein [Hansschlegelia sp. KR7-227]|uniref:M10 family metallopeptidase C-terminal domain-containing protein n=1 Tax=Hansschlegelia sp. KR7-227 TaxID=3400914 RepID=UPI003C038091
MSDVGKSGNDRIDGVLWGVKLDDLNVTYGFPTTDDDYVGYAAVNGFVAFNADQQAAVRVAMANVDQVCGIVATEATSGRPTFRFAMADTFDTGAKDTLHKPGGSNDSAEATPNDPTRFDSQAFGDMWFNKRTYNDPDFGEFGYTAGVLHEIGHSLGLKHGHAEQTTHGEVFPALGSIFNGQEYSVMTYRATTAAPGRDVTSSMELPQSLMMSDISALQYLYGADYGTNNTNTTYSFDRWSGEMSVNGVKQGVPFANYIFRTIWDGGGIDTYDFSNYGTNARVNLDPGAWSTPADDQRAFLGTHGTGVPGETFDAFAKGSVYNALAHNSDVRSLIENARTGAGADRLQGNIIANRLTSGLGDDTAFGYSGNDTLEGGGGADQLYGGAFNDVLDGEAGADLLVGDVGDDILNGGIGADTMRGNQGNDIYYVLEALDLVAEQAGEGYDIVWSNVSMTLSANVEELRLSGPAFNATGNSLSNVLVGNMYANRLDGGFGSDTMSGGAGNDTYVVSASGDLVIEAADAGADGVESYVDYTLSANVELLTLLGSARYGGGNAGFNRIVGNALDNTLYGAAGLDTLAGGAGNDVYELDSVTSVRTPPGIFSGFDQVIEEVGGGYDTVRVQRSSGLFGTSHTLAANVEAGVIVGSGAFKLSGNALSNSLLGGTGGDTLIGGDGNDTLTGGSGPDRLEGGLGNDVYVLQDYPAFPTGSPNVFFFRYDDVVESADAGRDTVRVERVGDLGVRYTLTANVEDGEIRGTGDFDLTGNGLDNRLTGNAAANILKGGDGSDTLSGGLGIDRLEGGAGDDDYYLSDYRTLVFPNGTRSIFYDGIGEAAGGGTDTVYLTVPAGFVYTLAANVENMVLGGAVASRASGNGLANLIIGNAGANVLAGSSGDDTIAGGLGWDTLAGGRDDDTYVLADTTAVLGPKGRPVHVFDVVDESAAAGGGGVDTVRIATGGKGIPGSTVALTSYTLTAGVENGVVALSGAFNLTGNELGNALVGNASANLLTGLAGADTLTGGSGSDTLVGGSGNDVYVINSGGDTIVEQAGGGVDEARASVDVTLADNVENLVVTGGARVVGVGNALDNLMTGNGAGNRLSGLDGNDTLNGGGGADTMLGGAGDDRYVVTSKNDAVSEGADGGLDLVQSTVGYRLGANVEQLTLLGVADLQGYGNGLANRIYGNAGDNLLDGGGGADSMTGGKGDDVYLVDVAGDRVSESAGGGVDLVRSQASFTLGKNVENLMLVGGADVDGKGNGQANIIVGNGGDNRLDGSKGADALTGGGGSDAFVFANGLGPGNIDRITDFAIGVDEIELTARFFPELSKGALAASAFAIGEIASDAADRILYDRESGGLFFDRDGTADAYDPLQFALLSANLNLKFSDFVVA